MNEENFNNGPYTDRSPIFLDVEDAIKYLITNEMIATTQLCPRCHINMKLEKSSRHINNVIYRCKNRNCRKFQSIFENCLLDTPKIKINDYLYIIYKWLENNFEKDICKNTSIAKRTFQKIKKKINRFLDQELNDIEKLGGKGIKVQIDETVICHGLIPGFPSQLEDDHPGLTWLVGLIEENIRRIKYEIVPNRSVETFTNLLERNVNRQSIIITDGHPSYSRAVRHIDGVHKVVNHSRGFKNEEGFHTNNIENLWSLLKYEITRRRGVLFSYLPEFLKEFNFRYKFLRIRNRENMKNAFKKIVRFLINTNEN